MPKYAPIVASGHTMDTVIGTQITDQQDQNAAVCVFAACYQNGLDAGTPPDQQAQYVFTLNLDSEPTSVACTVTRARTLPA